MKKLILILGVLFMATIVFGSDELCGVGETNSLITDTIVYFYGWGFEPECEFNWFVTAEKNDILQTKLVGYIKTSQSGSFITTLWETEETDTFTNFIYRKFENGRGSVSRSTQYSPPTSQEIPEFNPITTMIALIGSVGCIMFIKKK